MARRNRRISTAQIEARRTRRVQTFASRKVRTALVGQ